MRHFKQRLDQRINLVSSLSVSYENRNSAERYTKVGTINVSDQFKAQINQVVDKIESTDFGTRKDYAIKVAQFPLNSATVRFNSDADKNAAYGKQLVANLETADGESNGNEIYCIVRNNEIATFCFVKSYTGNENGLLGKLRVDGIIKKLKNFKKNR
jgi:hypothetical protein